MSLKVIGLMVATAVLGGCQGQSKGPAAEERYRIVERNGAMIDDLCREAGVVARAYLDDRNEEKYQTWHMTELAKCSEARLQL